MNADKSEDINKKVDESWKENVDKEKTAPSPKGDESDGADTVEVSFSLFISGLMMEALVALGDAQNPISKKKEVNKLHAKFIIDTLAVLQEKTKNNLTKDEEGMLESILYDLRMRFVNKTATKFTT